MAERRYVSAVDVLVGLGWLATQRVEEWCQGRVAYLEQTVEARLGNIAVAIRILAGLGAIVGTIVIWRSEIAGLCSAACRVA